MASQLRLHVLLPLAFLGLLGAGLGVYTMGKAPGGGGNDARVPLVTTHADKSKPAPQATNDWVKDVEAWCVGLETRAHQIDEPTSLADYESVLGEAVELWDTGQPTFVKLGLPPNKRSTALALRKNVDKTAMLLRRMFNRFQALDAPAIEARIDELGELGKESNRLFRRLGADKCLGEDAKGSARLARLAIQPAPLLINSQLRRYGKVVVLFYEPRATYDAIQTREARAGALLAHAGFVSVNVSKNRAVGQLASEYDVLQSPTVLIFTRGYNVKVRIEGFYDRTAIVQAVKNA